MSVQIVRPSPHELRVLVRRATYANTSMEVETVKRVDALVFDRVRTYERAVADAAEAFASEVEVDVTAARDVGNALAEEVRQALRLGDDPFALAKRFEELRRHAETALAALERAEREAEWHAEKCTDPYSHYVALMTKYPTLRPLLAT